MNTPIPPSKPNESWLMWVMYPFAAGVVLAIIFHTFGYQAGALVAATATIALLLLAAGTQIGRHLHQQVRFKKMAQRLESARKLQNDM